MRRLARPFSWSSLLSVLLLGSAATVVCWYSSIQCFGCRSPRSRLPYAGSDQAVLRRLPRVARFVILDRETALRTLGITEGEFDELSADEVKKAFKQQAVRWHPDSPGGDAKRFQDVREAYELLLNRRPYPSSLEPRIRSTQTSGGARVWQEGSPSYTQAQTQPQVGQGIPVALVFGVVLVLFGLAFGALAPQATTSPSTSRAGSAKTVQVVREGAQPLRGKEYVFMSSLAGRLRSELLLLGGPESEGEVEEKDPSQRMEGINPHSRQLAKSLLGLLDESVTEEDSAGAPKKKPKYKSISAVVSEADFTALLKVLRAEDEEKVSEPRFPYLIFSGRPVARFERELDETRQELLIITAFDKRRVSTERLDSNFLRLMQDEHPPDLLVLDLSEQSWREISGEYAEKLGIEPWTGVRLR